jgi:hypothetical protein
MSGYNGQFSIESAEPFPYHPLMGTEIHSCIEYAFRNTDLYDNERLGWFLWSDFSLNLGQNYPCFAALAGVRRASGDPCPLYKPRGFPVDESNQIRYERYMQGYYAHSYLKYSEVIKALEHYQLTPNSVPCQFRAALAAMKVLDVAFHVRIVFCFSD